MRLNKFIAENSKYSRRKADILIKDKMVSINGKLADSLGMQIDPEKDKIEINGEKIIQKKEEKVYFALNKPMGFVTTREDRHAKRTVMELLPKIENLKPVGRLDKETEGLLLFSNDGDFIQRHTHPKYECKKKYHAIIEGFLTDDEKKKLEEGVILEDKKTYPAKIQRIRRDKNETELEIEIHEGRNKQVRNMFAMFRHNVKYLQRIETGTIKLGNLKLGEFRKLTKEEINDNI
ncbi:rRNA pseudouridine synthase [Candidatus Gracilibacteria bacterium]|jgi:pseudouridine synthase|nr:rRNA pseudouridine synthase [Candidatus Gracilibacteria bacterium]